MLYVYVYIREKYVQLYCGNFKSDKCIVIHAKYTILAISTSPGHEIYSTYQFMGYGLTEHDTYPKAPKYLCDSRNEYCLSLI